MEDYKHFKKGIQYSHYTGAQRQNILDNADNAMHSITTGAYDLALIELQ